MNSNWKNFWFESNLCWGNIKCFEDWERIKKIFKDEGLGLDPLNAKECKWSTLEKPNYGFRREHIKKEILREFFKENNMKS
jgi:hypothetical protein